jgi:hypothetical protein
VRVSSSALPRDVKIASPLASRVPGERRALGKNGPGPRVGLTHSARAERDKRFTSEHPRYVTWGDPIAHLRSQATRGVLLACGSVGPWPRLWLAPGRPPLRCRNPNPTERALCAAFCKGPYAPSRACSASLHRCVCLPPASGESLLSVPLHRGAIVMPESRSDRGHNCTGIPEDAEDSGSMTLSSARLAVPAKESTHETPVLGPWPQATGLG